MGIRQQLFDGVKQGVKQELKESARQYVHQHGIKGTINNILGLEDDEEDLEEVISTEIPPQRPSIPARIWGTVKLIFALFVFHSIKISYIIVLLISILGLAIAPKYPYDGGFWLNLLYMSAILGVMRLIFGGWSAHTIKSMAWQVGMSTLGAIILIFVGFRQGGHPNMAWPVIWPIIVSVIVAILIYLYVKNIQENHNTMDEHTLIDRLFDHRIKGTFNIMLDECMEDVYIAAGRGAAAYSNTIIILGMIVCGYYAH